MMKKPVSSVSIFLAAAGGNVDVYMYNLSLHLIYSCLCVTHSVFFFVVVVVVVVVFWKQV